LLNKLAKYINQGGKRNGSISCYLEPWHADIFDFCDLRKNTGTDDNRARDLFLALWVPSLFMERVRNDEVWSLMCPDECPGLNLVHGEEFNKLYEKYESEKKFVKQIKARELWKHILEIQSETGFPYILYKDNANAKSNQKNLGTIRSSNLCAEIIQYSDEKETSVCNLASLCLPMFVEKNEKGKIFNYEKLMKITRIIVRNINKIIDRNYYPNEKTKRSNLRHRPMAIGVQGLADVYNVLGFDFSSAQASDLNKRIFETIYYAAIDESKELAKKYGKYSSFEGSPMSKGQLQFHLWGISEDQLLMGYDWKKLIEEVKIFGARNSLLTACMPTASTSQIMGNSECIEPYMSNIFKRSTLAGEFIVVNKNLMKDLIELNLWNDDMRKRLIIENGSIQKIECIPDKIKSVYKTAFEIKQMYLVRQSADRGIFIDQSQSFNLFMGEPDFDILTSALFEAHDLGNKTGIYYYRSLPAINPINFGIDVEDIKRLTGKDATIEMISGSYNIEKTNKNESVKIVKKYEKQNTSGSEFCKWIPGMKREDCIGCQ
jgi:ribonucleoside-diphosphate reductase alpha subunit